MQSRSALACVLGAILGAVVLGAVEAASTHACHARGENPLQKATGELGWYSHVVYARPDVRYNTPLDVALLRNLSDYELYTPDWGCWTGFNAVWNQILTRRRGLRRIR